MSRYSCNILVFIAILAIFSSCKTSRKDIREGNKLYKEFKYKESLKPYGSALSKDSKSIIALFNLSASLYKNYQYDSAVHILQRLIENPLEEQSNKPIILYNLGTTQLSWALANKKRTGDLSSEISSSQSTVDEQMDIIDKVKQSIVLDSMVVLQDSLEKQTQDLLYKCINNYKASLRINPTDSLSKYNLAYAQLLLPKDQYDDMKNKDKNNKESLTMYAKKLKGRADSLVKQYVFDTAYHIMDKGVKRDTTVKTYNDYIKKLKDVNDIKYKKK